MHLLLRAPTVHLPVVEDRRVGEGESKGNQELSLLSQWSTPTSSSWATPVIALTIDEGPVTS